MHKTQLILLFLVTSFNVFSDGDNIGDIQSNRFVRNFVDALNDLSSGSYTAPGEVETMYYDETANYDEMSPWAPAYADEVLNEMQTEDLPPY